MESAYNRFGSLESCRRRSISPDMSGWDLSHCIFRSHILGDHFLSPCLLSFLSCPSKSRNGLCTSINGATTGNHRSGGTIWLQLLAKYLPIWCPELVPAPWLTSTQGPTNMGLYSRQFQLLVSIKFIPSNI